MTPPATLVVLAAGLGSRFGGLKQFEHLGPNGEWLMDFSIHDALTHGMSRIVFVVRAEIVDVLRAATEERYRGRIEPTFALQRVDDLPSGSPTNPLRERPWGTAHAVLAARDHLDGPFVVLNADDFYGPEAFESIVRFLERSAADPERHAVAGYRLGSTLSPAGGVNRAVIDRRPDGTLGRIVEARDLRPTPAGGVIGRVGASDREFAPDTPVSMNLWVFQPSIGSLLTGELRSFLSSGPDARAELPLPDAIGSIVESGAATVEVLNGIGEWCGVTHPDDRASVRAFLADQVRQGRYPEPVWQ